MTTRLLRIDPMTGETQAITVTDRAEAVRMMIEATDGATYVLSHSHLNPAPPAQSGVLLIAIDTDE